MRILPLSQFSPNIIGGEEWHVRNFGAALPARGHQVRQGERPFGIRKGWRMGALLVPRRRAGSIVTRIERVYRDVARNVPGGPSCR
jgi:hypothetical protein